MRLILLGLLMLAACAPQHPLTYVSPRDPVWLLNPPEPVAAVEPTPVPPVAASSVTPPQAELTPSWHPLVITDPRIKSATNVVITR